MILSRSISPFERFGGYSPVDDATLTIHLFSAGETISGLAHRYYDDWRMWRLIADRNNIADVRKILPGTELLIPRRLLEIGAFESF